MTHQRNLYEMLEISKSATTEEIKKAYRVLAMRWHPDRNKSPEAEARFKEINYAYSVLSDPKKRADYDAGLRGVDSEATFSEEDAARVFLEEMFDLALHLAQAGYDENYIYRALIEEGCPGTIAAAAAKSAVKSQNSRSSRPRPSSRPSSSGRLQRIGILGAVIYLLAVVAFHGYLFLKFQFGHGAGGPPRAHLFSDLEQQVEHRGLEPNKRRANYLLDSMTETQFLDRISEVYGPILPTHEISRAIRDYKDEMKAVRSDFWWQVPLSIALLWLTPIALGWAVITGFRRLGIWIWRGQ